MSDNSSMANFGNSFEKSNKEKIIKNPTVSVITLVYYHQNTIKQCLDSILAQRTDFGVELIIGEDCSTDSSMEIISEYLAQYPEMIRVITAEKNVGMIANTNRCYNACRGKFIALCEGDDYWIDPYKLQKQFDYMEKHSNCSLCFHAHERVYAKNSLNCASYPKFKSSNGIYYLRHLIAGGGGFMATNSMFFRNSDCSKMPLWMKNYDIGDLPLMLWLGSRGYTYYINEVMSAYRISSSGSWSEKQDNRGVKQTIVGYMEGCRMWWDFFKWQKGRYIPQFLYRFAMRTYVCLRSVVHKILKKC